jgi:hypothetical protein
VVVLIYHWTALHNNNFCIAIRNPWRSLGSKYLEMEKN